MDLICSILHCIISSVISIKECYNANYSPTIYLVSFAYRFLLN